MQDKSITSALIALRKQIIRGNLDGLPHVDALLAARGIDPATLRVETERKPYHARKGAMRRMVMDALRDGPKPQADIAALVGPRRPEIGPQTAHYRTGRALDKMRRAGLVKCDGRVWRLA